MSKLKILKGWRGGIFQAIMNGLMPRGGAFGPGAADYDLLPMADRMIRSLNPLIQHGFPFLLLYVQFSTLLKKGRVFTRLSMEDAEKHLAGMDESRLYYKRMIMLALKMITFIAFYDIDENAEHLGYRHWAHVKNKAGRKSKGKKGKSPLSSQGKSESAKKSKKASKKR